MTIDADLSEWNSAALVSAFPEDASSRAGILYFMYDKDNLYVAGEVKDESPLMNDKVGTDAIWNGDCIEVYICADPNADPKRMEYGPNDRQFGLAMAPKPSTWCWQNGKPLEGAVVVTKEVEFGSDKHPGYVFEAKIPQKSIHPNLNLKALKGKKIGFAAAIDFSNAEGSAREIQHSWSFASNGAAWNNPSVWGTAFIK